MDDKILYKVDKLRFKSKDDKSTIIFNDYITIDNIPEATYQYFVNGKTAVGWIMDRYLYKQDKDSKIVNDPNSFSEDPKYVFNLLLSVIALSVKTVEIMNVLDGYCE